MGFAFYHEGSAVRVALRETRGEGLLFLRALPSMALPGADRGIAGLRKDVSDETRRDAALSEPDLWLRYFELGGMSTPAEVDSYLRCASTPSAHEHDMLAHALNERFSELGRDHPVPYAEAGG